MIKGLIIKEIEGVRERERERQTERERERERERDRKIESSGILQSSTFKSQYQKYITFDFEKR